MTLLLSLLFTSSGSALAANSKLLTLPEAENLALWLKFKLQPTKASLNTIDLLPEADSPSSDTHLVFDTINLSPNTIIPNQDDMTVVKVGVRKAFSNEETQEIKSRQAQVFAQQKNNEYKKRLLLRDVRHDWLELYYWHQVKSIIQQHYTVISLLADKIVAESLLPDSIGQKVPLVPKEDALWARLVLSTLQNKKDITQGQLNLAKKQLARWIGQENSNRPLPNELPNWPVLPSLINLQMQLINHPQLQADVARIKSLQAEIAWTKELNKPTFEVGASYGMRQQDAINVDPKLNMISGELSLNLPSHIGNTQKQDTLVISNRLNTARRQQQTDSRNLLKSLIKQYQSWQNLDRPLKNNDNSQGTINTADTFLPLPNLLDQPSPSTVLLQQQLMQLELQLKQLRAQLDLAQARAGLRYFEKN